ncbi:MAG: tetraacyldisaccharide 4'-kinase [Desulfobacteraceae bacterium]|nr:MAG: tetraacyldisaccharide 4'-kinase [Desulfobacteraceae bacterium]
MMSLKTQKQKLEKKIGAIVASRGSHPVFSLATLLYGGSLLYGAGVRMRQSLYAHGVLSVGQVNRPVISIGNLTAGGTGKTPLAIHLAKLLDMLGLKVLIVSRGYKSLSEKTGAVVSDGRTILCDWRSAGDEPFLMARMLMHVPVMVGKDRFATASAGLQRFAPDIVLLDDAFQHQGLARDVNLLLLDANEPLGNGHLLPRGPLREPIAALKRADAIIFTRCAQPPNEKQRELARMIHPRPVFYCGHAPVVRCLVPAMHPLVGAEATKPPAQPGNPLQGRSVFAFAALARNETFWSTVSGMGALIQGVMGFSDHHFYSAKDIDGLVQAASQSGCHTLVTTDKDFVRLPRMSLPLDLIVLGVDIDFGVDYDRWQRFIADRLQPFARLAERKAHRKGTTGSLLWMF